MNDFGFFCEIELALFNLKVKHRKLFCVCCDVFTLKLDSENKVSIGGGDQPYTRLLLAKTFHYIYDTA